MALVVPNKVSEPQSVELASILGTRLPNEMLEHIFHFLNAEELARIAPVCRQWAEVASSKAVSLSYGIPFPSWIKDIDADIWGMIDLKKYGLDLSEVPRVNRRALTKALKPLSRKVENEMGITNIVIPKGLTLNKVLQIAKDYSVPISPRWFDQIIPMFGDIPAEQTRVLFFTNSLLEETRDSTSDQEDEKITTIGKICKVALQEPNIRDFMAFLVLTYLSSPADDRVRLYSKNTYTRLIEKVNDWVLWAGFGPYGLLAINDYFGYGNIGVGASGSSEGIL
jgi:hypothetical protein